MLTKSILTGLFLGVVAAAGADPALLRMLPAEPQMVAGLDVERARDSVFGRRILAEMKDEDEGFRKLVDSTGFDPRRDLREVAMGVSGLGEQSRAVVAVRGTFDGARIGRFLEAEGGQKVVYRGVEIWKGKQSKGEEGFAFLNGTLAVFGAETLVRQAVDRHLGGAAGIEAALAARVSDWSGRGDAWFVSGVPLGAMGRGPGGLVPGGLPVDVIREAAVGVRLGSVVEVSGELAMRSAQDATALADVVRFMVSMLRSNTAQPGAAELSKIADSLQLGVSGDQMKFSVAVSEEQLDRLLGSRTKRAARR